MIFKTKSAALLTIALVVGLVAYGVSSVSAQTLTKDDLRQDLIQQLAQKLGIEQSKVEQAFDEIHTQRQSQMQQQFEQRLSQAVTDGKINEAQKSALIQKHNELREHKDPETLRNLTPEQRREEMQDKRVELESWAESQGIDSSVLPEILGRGMGPGKGGMMHGGWR